MVAALTSAALLGLAAVVNAHPYGPPGYPTTTTHTAKAAGQTPFKFPLANGFPNIKVPSSELTQIELQAHGTLPNTALPKKLSAADATVLQVIAFNEIFEVAFFSSLIQNITSGGSGGGNGGGWATNSQPSGDMILSNLQAIRAQEELHAIGANAILASAGETTIKPCEYIFPSDSLTSAIRFASTFTDVVLGTLQDAQAAFAANGDAELVPLVSSIVGQEGEQDGWYRSELGLVPSQLPFLTRSAGPFAFSVLNQLVIKKGSCPNLNAINVPIFDPLTLTTSNVQAKTQTLSFSFQAGNTKVSNLSLVYINQQNAPIIVKLQNVKTNGKTTTFQANFPYTANLMNGLTLAVLTSSDGPFTSVDAVADKTIFGPALIEIM